MEVWLLHIRWEANMPMPEHTSIQGVYATWDLAEAAAQKLVAQYNDGKGPGILSYHVYRWDVKES
jgi:hypothetical protein